MGLSACVGQEEPGTGGLFAWSSRHPFFSGTKTTLAANPLDIVVRPH